jgi:hypothetical protein
LMAVECIVESCVLIGPPEALKCAATAKSRGGCIFLISTSDRRAVRKPQHPKLAC